MLLSLNASGFSKCVRSEEESRYLNQKSQFNNRCFYKIHGLCSSKLVNGNIFFKSSNKHDDSASDHAILCFLIAGQPDR